MAKVWNVPDWPKHGDLMALHVIASRKATVKARFQLWVGPEPWGRRGKLDGKNIINGRLVAEAEIDDEYFNYFMVRIAQDVIQKAGVEGAEAVGELVLSLRDHGFQHEQVAKRYICRECTTVRTRPFFSRDTNFAWRTNAEHRPRFVGSRPCVECFEARARTLRGIADRAFKMHDRKGSSEDVLFSVAQNISCEDVVAMSDPEAFSARVSKLELFCQDLRDNAI